MNLYSKYKKAPEAWAAAAALIAGYVVHNFALVNVLHNIDDISNSPFGYGVGISSGRWMLSLMGDLAQALGGGFNLPFVNGLVFLILMALSAGVLVSVFRIKNRCSAVLVGLLLVVFPSAATVLYYRFTAIYYGIAFLMAVLAVWILDRKKYGWALSALLIGCSLGIYQAYAAVTIGVMVLLLIRLALDGDSTPRELVKRGLLDCLALVLGLAVYFVCLKVCLGIYGEPLSDYNSVDQLGGFALGDLPQLVWKAFKTFCKFPLTNYCSLAVSGAVKLAYVLLGGLTAVEIGYLLAVKVKKAGTILLTLALCLIFPVAVNFVMVMAPDAALYTMMAYSFVLVGCMPLVLWECMPASAGRFEKLKKLGGKAGCALLVLLVVSYGYLTNVNDTANYYVNRQVENYVSSIVTQVRMTEGYDAQKKWAFIGQIEDPRLDPPWQYELTYGGLFDPKRTLNDMSQYAWFWNYIGYRVPTEGEEAVQALARTEAVKAMPCWPAQGSIQVIGDTVVVKFQELS